MEPLESRVLFSVGSIDPTFGTNGQVTVSFNGTTPLTSVRDSKVLSDGSILLAGQAADAGAGVGSSDFAVAKLTPSGALDSTFGAGGVAVIHSSGADDAARSIAVEPNGQIVAVGSFVSDTSSFEIVRLNADGTPDTAFGTNGLLTPDFGATSAGASGSSVLILGDGSILAGGNALAGPSNQSESALVKVRADGTLDPTFGTNGIVTSDLSGGPETVLDLAVQTDGRILASGVPAGADADAPSFLVERFNADGSADTSFAGTGFALATFTGAADAAAKSVIVQPDGKIVLGGYVVSGNVNTTTGTDLIYNFGLARFTSKGVLDRKFGQGGLVLGSPGHITGGFQGFEVIDRVTYEPGGGLVVSGLHSTTTGTAATGDLSPIVAGYELNGSPDTGFGASGQMIFNSPSTGTGSSVTQAIATQVTPADQNVQFRTIQQKDAAIINALNDRFILAGSSGGVVTVSRLIGDGPDLMLGVPIGLKARSVMGGAKAIVSVPITNDGSAPFAGSAPITLLVSTDQTADANDETAATISPGLKIKDGATKSVKLKFDFPTDLADGNYFLIAQIAPPSGSDTNAGNNVAADTQPVTIAKPFVDLNAAFAPPNGLVGSLTPGRNGKLLVVFHNNGNVTAKGPVAVALVASSDNVADASDHAIQVLKPAQVNLKPEASKAITLKVAIPSDLPAASYFLIGTITDAGLPDTVLGDKTFAGASEVQIG